jgi:ribose transport system permease protein
MGSLDFSHGSLVALSAGLGALVMGYTNNVVLCFLTIVGFASLTGLANGIVLTKFKVPSFILTMSVLFMYRGLTIAVCKGGSIPIPLWMGKAFDTFPIKLGVLLIVLLVFNYIYSFTKFGLYCRSIGSGELAAKYAGVPTHRIKILVFVISGFLAGVAACIMLIRNGGISTRFATFLETDILTSLVLGGMPLTGGSGAKMWSIIIGAFMIMALKNGLLLMGATDKVLQLIMGVLFLIAVSISFDRRNVTVIK